MEYRHDDGTIFAIVPLLENSEALMAQLIHRERYLPFIEKMCENRKKEWLSVRVLLKKLLGEEKEIIYKPSGKPYLADNSYHISISHTQGYVCLILNRNKEVAIDIEKISFRVEKIWTRFVNSEEENNLSKANRLIHLLLHWSAKESVFKILDAKDVNFKTLICVNAFEPVINDWSSFRVKELQTLAQKEYTVKYFVHADYVLTYIIDS
ncbi:MAG: 4'-phosphopantetheinyl transferase superfamily protein [Dysgonamonadaceae bacterium]|jgi:4'-phosphopantetheinyl transferase EntD|nr:4'-phosphopantetheinyl transferase superfamily protein [Dysgonamonadaceae bacterium]